MRDHRRRGSVERAWQHDKYRGGRQRETGEEEVGRRVYLPPDSRSRYEASLEAGLDGGRDDEPYLADDGRARRSPIAEPRLPRGGRESPPRRPPREDWVCCRCQALNFGRRLACFVCSSSREGAQAAGGLEAGQRASCTLRVTGLTAQVDRAALLAIFQPFTEVKDVRIVRGSRGPAAPADCAFVVFHSHQEAGAALAAVQTHAEALAAQFGPLAVAFAEEGLHGGGGSANAHAPDSVLEGTSWEPASFDEAGPDEAAAAAAGADEGRQGGDPSWEAGEPSGPSASAAAGGQADPEAAGFVYDPASGYLYDAGSGYYYDANSGMYCHPSLGVWGSLDGDTGAFAPCEDPGTGDAGVSSAAEASLAAAHEAVEAERRRASGAARLAGTGAGPPGAAPGPQPRRSAVIGAAAQLDAQGLLEAARASQQREVERARAASKVHRPPAGLPTPAPIPAAAAPAVQGVVHRGKWAQRALK